MELEGEGFYLKLAKMNKDNNLHGIFKMLADDEKDHAHILQQKEEDLGYTLKKSQTFHNALSVFRSMGKLKSDIKEIPSQIASYNLALEKEKESIDLYTDLKKETQSNEDKETYDYLIEQEKEHYDTIKNLISFLTQSDDWVESAEFGVREQY
jgi:rubrerythrin